MPRPSRARRILKWTGVGLSILILTAWLIARWAAPFINLTYEATIGLNGGTFVVRCGDPIRRREEWVTWYRPVAGSPVFEMPYLDWHNGTTLIKAPFWLLLLLTAIPTAWLWHRDRRRIRPGCCLRCGYDLTGNTSGVCSECGLAKPPPATA